MNDEEIRAHFVSLRDEDRAAASPFELPARSISAGSPLFRAAAAAASLITVIGAVGVGMAWGTTAGYASGRVEGDQRRAVTDSTARGATIALAALRSELVRTRAQLSTAGTRTTSIAAVGDDLRAIEERIQRIETDLMTRASSAEPVPASRNVAMNRAMAVTCAALEKVIAPAESQQEPSAQQGTPTVDPPGATIRTSSVSGAMLERRQRSR
jgi:hypothetical protein